MNIENKINKAVKKINDKGYTVFYIKNRNPEPRYGAPDAWGVDGHVPLFVHTDTQGDVPVDTGEHSDLGFDYLLSWDYVIKCKEGHKQTVKHGNVSLIRSCPFCDGKQYTVKQVSTLLDSSGMSLDSGGTVDSSNNQVVRQGDKISYTCAKGHKVNERFQQTLNKVVDGKVICTLCSGSAHSYPTSRSEEIIEFVLEANGVYFDREVSVSRDLRSLKFDFVLPELSVIIEYDGEHHKYGSHGGKNLEVYQRNDALKDKIAKDIGYTMIRIPHNVQGMRIVWFLKECLLDGIDIFNPMYKEFIEGVYDLTSELYGWEPMSVYQERADVYIHMRKTKAMEYTGLSASVLQRAYDIAYGIPLADYRKTQEYLKRNHSHSVDSA